MGAGVVLNGSCNFVFSLVLAPWACTQIVPVKMGPGQSLGHAVPPTAWAEQVGRAVPLSTPRVGASMVHALSMELAAPYIKSGEKA